MLKLSENPPLIWPDKRIRDFDGTWWVVHCKSRNEKALAWDMVHKEINYFLPMSLNVRKTKGRTVKTLLPLFSSYVFFCGNEVQRREILRTNRVANIINVQDQGRLVRELEAIERVLVAGIALEPCRQFDRGCSHRVITGPLVDTKGQIIHINGKTHLVLTVDVLGLAISVGIASGMLEKLN